MNDAMSSEMQLVVFRLGQEEYGVSILQVQEIRRLTEITRVPHTPSYVQGVMNLRGNVTPVLDLKKRIGLPEQATTNDTRIIIVKVADVAVGMIVDAVSEVLQISTAAIDSSESVGGVAANYIQGIGKLDNRLIILLNLEAITGIAGDTAKVS
jgi:purine-binding chemotaxis protein CheW